MALLWIPSSTEDLSVRE